VHDMMDDIAEQQDVAREISDAISNPVAFGQDIDEVRNYMHSTHKDVKILHAIIFKSQKDLNLE
jgi:hypothetical protein